MKLIFADVLLLLVLFGSASADSGSGSAAGLDSLLDEALVNNPDIQAAIHEMGRATFSARQQGVLDDPVLLYKREEMPEFHWNDPAVYRIGLQQAIRFPTKLGRESEIADLNAEHAHHFHLERVNEVLKQVKLAYYDLWYAQERVHLNRETARLLMQFTESARTRYRVGDEGQQVVLRATVEVARVDNQNIELDQGVESAKAILMALLNREPTDTLAPAVLDSNVRAVPPVDSLEAMALRNRPALVHDSLTVREKELASSLAGDEYIPDLILGVEYVNRPDLNRDGWSVIAGISLPFAPWTLGRAGNRVDEADAAVSEARALLVSSRNMVLASVRDGYLKARSAKTRLQSYNTLLLPQSHQAFEATLVAYRTGKTDFLTLIDSYRTLVDLSEEALEVRKEFESALAVLEREIGVDRIGTSEVERERQ